MHPLHKNKGLLYLSLATFAGCILIAFASGLAALPEATGAEGSGSSADRDPANATQPLTASLEMVLLEWTLIMRLVGAFLVDFAAAFLSEVALLFCFG